MLAMAVLAVSGWQGYKAYRTALHSAVEETPLMGGFDRPGFVPSNTPAAVAVSPGAPTASASPNARAQTKNETAINRPVANVFEAQLALDRLGISSGSVDGVLGPQTRSAILVFQQINGLRPTGTLNAATCRRLRLHVAPLRDYVVTAADLAALSPPTPTWEQKSQCTWLGYNSPLELVAEQGHAYPNFIRHLNPRVNWSHVAAGTVVRIPNVGFPPVREKAAYLRISLSTRHLFVYGSGQELLASFPCSIGRSVASRPLGELRVERIAQNPTYRFDPAIFPESPSAQAVGHPLLIPPGPNNPVGTAWIGLDRPGYGIHGTPAPESVGRTESHGCFRLANWNATYLSTLVWVGMPVYIQY